MFISSFPFVQNVNTPHFNQNSSVLFLTYNATSNIKNIKASNIILCSTILDSSSALTSSSVPLHIPLKKYFTSSHFRMQQFLSLLSQQKIYSLTCYLLLFSYVPSLNLCIVSTRNWMCYFVFLSSFELPMNSKWLFLTFNPVLTSFHSCKC